MAKCYLCGEDAVGSCADCHKPVCAAHYVDSITWGNLPARKCTPCAQKTSNMMKYIIAVGLGIVVIVFIFILSIFFGMMWW